MDVRNLVVKNITVKLPIVLIEGAVIPILVVAADIAALFFVGHVYVSLHHESIRILLCGCGIRLPLLLPLFLLVVVVVLDYPFLDDLLGARVFLVFINNTK